MNIEEKLKESVMLVKLSTNEDVVGLSMQIGDKGINLGFPYLIVKRTATLEDGTVAEIPVLEKFCPYTKNRFFPIMYANIIFAKDVKDAYADVYMKHVADNEPHEYIQLLRDYQETLRQQTELKADASEIQKPEATPDIIVQLDDQHRIVVSGNTTKH